MRDPQTPLALKLVGALCVGYALSPIDLIPDFIPILGLLDDLVLLPIGIVFVLRRLPADLLAEFLERADQFTPKRNWIAACVIVAIWIVMGLGVWRLFG